MLINRWFHVPKLHVPDPHEEKKPSWLELFYDLVYVAAIIQLGNGLSHHPGFLGFLQFGALFYFLWTTWASFSFFYNRFNVDDALQRLLVFSQMFAIGGMAVSVAGVFDGDHALFIGCLSVARLITALMYTRAWRAGGPGASIGQVYAVMCVTSAVVWAASIMLPAPWLYVAWGIAALIDLYGPISERIRQVDSSHPADGAHIVERFGLLTIIVLGEMFVKVLTEISEKGATSQMLATASMGLVITCSLWWLYFDDVAGSRVKRKPWANYVWVYIHCPMMLGITAVGVAIKKAVFFDPGYVAVDKYRYLLCGVLALTLFCMAVIDWVTERNHAHMRDHARVKMRFAGGVLVLLMAPAGAYMPAFYFLLLVATCCVVQVLFDLAMAPERPEHAEHAGLFNYVTHDAAPSAQSGDGDPAPQPRLRVEDAIRLGTPDALRQDLYFRLMQGSWLQLISMAGITFILTNVFFGALFLLQPESIAGAEKADFLNAFAFSIQTFTTVGYGTLTPATAYGELLVTIETFVGIVWVALVTGLVFAKAARPESSVLFSEVAVITRYQGKPTFMFRLGNARGNSVVEASLNMTAVVDEVSPEGHRMKRLYDLELIRSRQPLFALSWTVFHVIDESSPFFGATEDTLADTVPRVIATLVGHDETYANTVHARHSYMAEDVVFDHDFVDVMSTKDGRFVLDFRKFHMIKPHEQTALDSQD